MLRVGFIAPGAGLRSLSESERYAYGWICERSGIAARLLPVAEAGTGEVDILWWHAARSLPPDTAVLKTVTGMLAERIEAGTALLLTGTALAALPLLGLEEEPPRSSPGEPYAGPVGEHELRGHLTFAGHPAFRSFGTGAYTWKPAAGVPVWDAWYEAAAPPCGRIVCVERRYIGLDPTRFTGLSWARESSRVGALGTHLPFHDRANPLRSHLELLVEGWLRWLAQPPPDRSAGGGPGAGEPDTFLYAGFRAEQRDRAWPVPRPGVCETAPDPVWAQSDLPAPLSPPAPGAFDAIWKSEAPRGCESVTSEPGDDFFDVVGRRHIVLGHARSGVAEAWTGGLRLFRRLALSWQAPGGKPVLLDDPRRSCCRRTALRPGSWRRELEFPPDGAEAGAGGELRQIVVAHPELGGGGTLIEVSSPSGGTLHLEGLADLRLQWPLPAGILAPLACSHPAGGIVALRGSERDMGGVLALTGPRGPGRWTAAPASAPDPSGAEEVAALRLLGEVELPPGRHTVCLAWAASTSGPRPLERVLTELVADPERVVRLAELRLNRLTTERVRLETPDRDFGEAFNRAVAGLDPFLFTSDKMGSSLLAGFNVTGRDWLSGRPGYAWFFGRDSVFTALGLLALGDREAAPATLRFLAAHQEFTGKILHEATLSGVVHYDAADATPLWLILLGAWYRATGENGLVRELWPAARRAFDFCRRTDTDRDGLIENTGVGHGWIEGGALYGAHVTSYLAGVWAAAADAFADCAEAVGRSDSASEARRLAGLARGAFEDTFWIEAEERGTGSAGHYALGLNLDRSVQPDLTVMPTVPIGLGQTDPVRARAHLMPLAGEEFNADWGMRMVGRSHPHFDPRGYHYGSIWPLYTGWTAQAEYRTHRHESGLAHLQAGLATLFTPPAGCLEEVLHGEIYGPAGVCPHQAWSHATLLQAAVEGLIGWRPDARPGARSSLVPHLPEDWHSLRCTGLRVGERRLSAAVEGEPGRRTWRLELAGGEGPFELRFSPALPPEARLERLTVDGSAEHAIISDTTDGQHLELDLTLVPGRAVEIGLEYVFDLVVVIPPPALEPGARSSHWRLVDRWWEGGEGSTAAPPEACRLILEGPPGSRAAIDCLMPGRRPKAVLGAEWAEPPRRGRGRLLVQFPEAPEPLHDGPAGAVDHAGAIDPANAAGPAGAPDTTVRYTAVVVQVSFG